MTQKEKGEDLLADLQMHLNKQRATLWTEIYTTTYKIHNNLGDAERSALYAVEKFDERFDTKEIKKTIEKL